MNGGTIKDAADNDAVLDHQAVAADTRHRVDGSSRSWPLPAARW